VKCDPRDRVEREDEGVTRKNMYNQEKGHGRGGTESVKRTEKGMEGSARQ